GCGLKRGRTFTLRPAAAVPPCARCRGLPDRHLAGRQLGWLPLTFVEEAGGAPRCPPPRVGARLRSTRMRRRPVARRTRTAISRPAPRAAGRSPGVRGRQPEPER